jgi:hypothetical protein
MSQIQLQQVKAPDGKLYGLTWDDSSNEVYVHQIGGFGVDSSKKSAGKASSGKEAMAKAEAWAYMQR